jgi:hypothetical protein
LEVIMRNRTARLAVVAISALAFTLTSVPAHASSGVGVGGFNYTFRSDHHPKYWLHGISSDAADGYFNDGTFSGEADVIVDGNDAYYLHGPVERCQVQLNRVVGHRAYPIPGHTNTNISYDGGRSCYAWDSWDVPAGRYNVTVSYEANGHWYNTVQGPVVKYLGN